MKRVENLLESMKIGQDRFGRAQGVNKNVFKQSKIQSKNIKNLKNLETYAKTNFPIYQSSRSTAPAPYMFPQAVFTLIGVLTVLLRGPWMLWWSVRSCRGAFSIAIYTIW